MSLPPSSALSACLKVLSRACIEARQLAWNGEHTGLTSRQSAELAALMDAVHNIPYLLQNWERCDEELLRGMLADFDQRYRGSPFLLGVYDQARNQVKAETVAIPSLERSRTGSAA